MSKAVVALDSGALVYLDLREVGESPPELHAHRNVTVAFSRQR